jgi:hypothetical protein
VYIGAGAGAPRSAAEATAALKTKATVDDVK